MMPYQKDPVEAFLRLLPQRVDSILEIGSDVSGLVTSELRRRTGAFVVGINPASDFPTSDWDSSSENTFLMRSDGTCLPFADESFDAVVSIATMEHVNDLDLFMKETARVLKPRGVFYTNFSPIWSSATGHHVFAEVGRKEARFWKPGKNPIPHYAHLVMAKDEMRQYLESGPCADDIIEPIIRWIYDDAHINRCFFEDYLRVFKQSTLEIQKLKVFESDITPDSETAAKLSEKYATRHTFLYSGLSAVFRKVPPIESFERSVFRSCVRARKVVSDFRDACGSFIRRNFPYVSILKAILNGSIMKSRRHDPGGS